MQSYTFQFWSREWLSQELFIKTILADFHKSLVLGFDGESEFQTFADGCPNKVSLSEFPQCPIWYDLRHYLLNEEFLRPVITLPESSLIDLETHFRRYHTAKPFYPLVPYTLVCPRSEKKALTHLRRCPLSNRRLMILEFRPKSAITLVRSVWGALMGLF